MNQAGATADRPLYFRFVRDDQGIRWDRLVLALAVTALTAYVSVKSQKAAASPDFDRTLRMALAQRKITYGVRMQRAGKAIEEAGWAAYEKARP